jgi:hypothetical protein
VIVTAVCQMSPHLFDTLLSKFELEPARYADGTYTQYEIIKAIYAKIGTRADFTRDVLAQFDAAEQPEAEFMFL